MSASGFAAVGIGAALGAWLRWILSVAFNAVLTSMPLGTLAANLIGAYLIGIAIEYLTSHVGLPPEIRLFVITGFLGGLTTFSSFSAESVALLSRGQYGWTAVHIAAHLIGSIVLTVLGILTVNALSR